MSKLKVLNLYCGIGGNRKLWKDVKVTAVELNPKIAAIYQDFFPEDKVIVTDAHQYLLEHFKEFDFIWSSPPCPSHSVNNNYLHAQGVIRYPDMKLYEEIIFLKKWFKGKYCIENVKSYYSPLIIPIELDRHYFWTNFFISNFKVKRNFNINNARASTRQSNKEYLSNLEDFHNIYLNKRVKGCGYSGKRLLLRNCVYPPLGLHILNESKRDIQPELFK